MDDGEEKCDEDSQKKRVIGEPVKSEKSLHFVLFNRRAADAVRISDAIPGGDLGTQVRFRPFVSGSFRIGYVRQRCAWAIEFVYFGALKLSSG